MPKKQDDSPKPSLPSEEDNNQTRTVGMPLRSSDFDKVPDRINPFTQMADNPCRSGKGR